MFIPNKQTPDPVLASLKGGDGFYDAQKVLNAIAKYDLIIYTQSGVFDTTRFNMKAKTTGIEIDASLIENTNGDSIELVYNPVSTKEAIQGNKLNSKCRAVVIPARTIEKIIVKGRRNFLNNRNPVEPISK